MGKVLLDTCSLIDLAIKGRPRHGRTVEVVSGLQGDGHSFFLLASSIKDVYYLLERQTRNEALARQAALRLRSSFGLVELTGDIVDRAFASDEPDFEDGLVRAAAEACRCGLIVTADRAAFEGSSVKKLLVEV